MNHKAKHILKSFIYTIVSNVLSLAISTLVVLIIPKVFGVEEYGYWQLYAFYTSYVGFMHFGWNDGIYLRYGGYEYEKLDKGLFFSQFYMLVGFQLLIGAAILFLSNLWVVDEQRNFIIAMSAVSMFIMNVRYFNFFVLQATNRIRAYSLITIIDRVLYAVLLVALLLLKAGDYKTMIFADLVARGATLGLSMYACREIAWRRVSEFRFSFREAWENVSVGSKLMFANIAGMLITGVIRFAIEQEWDIATFGKVSLTLSLSNLLMIFINTIGIVIYPLLRRTEITQLSRIYKMIRGLLLPVLFAFLVFFFPLRIFLLRWLPNYAQSIRFMAIVFPIVVYEGQMSLMVNTFYKTLREEAKLLQFNVMTLALSLVLALTTALLMHNLELAVLSIVVLLAFRCIVAERWIAGKLDLHLDDDMLVELSMVAGFILVNWMLDSGIGFIVYIALYFLYLAVQRKKLVSTFRQVRGLVRSKEE